MKTQSSQEKSSPMPSSTRSPASRRSMWARWAVAAAVGASAVAAGVAALPSARADAPAAAAAPAAKAPAVGDMKPFVEKVTGTDLQFDLVPIPAGTFKLGSPESEKKRGADEGPQVEVAVEPFYMGKYEVTWDLYNEFMNTYGKLGSAKTLKVPPVEKIADAVSYPTPIYEVDAGPKIQRMGGRQGNYPAVIMSDFAARQYCKWLSAKTGRFYRLPTEAEWEYAARGGTNTAYFFGDDPKQLDGYAWYTDNSELKDKEAGYHEVGQKKPNPFGLFDILGNVSEIVYDQYDAEQYKALAAKAGGKALAARDAVRWADKQYPRIVRGGGYESDPEMLRSAARQKITVAYNAEDPQRPKSPYWWTNGFSTGFRVVSPVKEPTAEEKHKFWDVDNDAVKDILTRDREIRQYVDEVAGGPKPATKPAGQ
jgi:formylglycine-generating enzyme required for sulfatase activity